MIEVNPDDGLDPMTSCAGTGISVSANEIRRVVSKGGPLGPGKVAEPHSAFNNPSSAEMVPKGWRSDCCWDTAVRQSRLGYGRRVKTRKTMRIEEERFGRGRNVLAVMQHRTWHDVVRKEGC